MTLVCRRRPHLPRFYSQSIEDPFQVEDYPLNHGLPKRLFPA
jgi:hypothetical protein